MAYYWVYNIQISTKIHLRETLVNKRSTGHVQVNVNTIVVRISCNSGGALYV